jgi:hypothetical protein
VCNDADTNHARRGNCIAFGNMRIDAAVGVACEPRHASWFTQAVDTLLAARNCAVCDPSSEGTSPEQAREGRGRARIEYEVDLRIVWSPGISSGVGMNGCRGRLESDLRVLRSAASHRSRARGRSALFRTAICGAIRRHRWKRAQTILRAVLEEIVVTVESGDCR